MNDESTLIPPEDWLERTNEELSANEVPHIRRPMDAWIAWSMHTATSLSLTDPPIKRIFAWFEKHSPEGSQKIGLMFTGSYYFDASFWPVTVCPIVGTVRIDPWKSLSTMPDAIKARLFESDQTQDFVSLWMDCVDYGLGFDEVISASPDDFAIELLISANQQLRSGISMLHQRHPNPNALESARMATEMFLKAYLARHAALTNDDARGRLGHDLGKALKEILKLDPKVEIANISEHLAVFPRVGDRYKGSDHSRRDLWLGYQIAQFAGTFVVRKFGGRDVRKQSK